MKFSDGCWGHREGFNLHFPAEIYDYKKEDTKLTLFMPTRPINHRGDTLNATMITTEITFPLEGVARINSYRFMGMGDIGPYHHLDMNNRPFSVEETENELILKEGKTTLHIKKSNGYQMDFYYGDALLTSSKDRALSFIQHDAENKTYFREQLSIGVGELLYGLGERFMPFVRNGQSIDIWQNDGGTGSEQSYKNIPFYISNKGYGVFVNHLENVSYEIASEKVAKAQFSVEGESLDYFLIAGPDMKEVLGRYTSLSGKPALPPAWSFGLWLSTSFTTNYDEATVMSFIDGMIEREIPLDVFHFDCFWMKGFEWCNFTWDESLFPDPKGMLSRIKAKGLKICLWINPYIGQKSPLFLEGMENGYFIKRENGAVWQYDFWQPGLAIVDFTNPAAVKWYQDKLEVLLDMGVDCFKTDFGERIPTDGVYFDGSSAEKMHNYYAYLYNDVVFDLLKRKMGEEEAVVFARSAAAGGQKFPVHWGGDSWSNYPSMAESLRGGLSFVLSGFSYWSHDISGFEQHASEDLYKRWTQFGLLSSHSRFHGSTEYKVPWHYGEEAVAVTRAFTKLKNSLMPYLFSEAVFSHKTGIPMMRPMVLEFTSDENTNYLDRQYMLGSRFLVSPIFNDENIGRYYLPAGRWTNFITGDEREGGVWHSESYDYFNLPVMVRENSIIAVGDVETSAVYQYENSPALHVFSLTNTATCDIYDNTGALVTQVTAVKDGNRITVSLSKALTSGFKVLLRNITAVAGVEGGEAPTTHKLGVLISCKADKVVITL